jgi:NlpC/P60 family
VFRSPLASAAALSAALVAPSIAAAQQSDLSVSPFVSFLPVAGGNPLAGLALTLAGNGGLGLRASAHMALENSSGNGFGSTTSIRPWGADADAVLSLGRAVGGYNRGFAPFVFAGIGTAAKDSAGYRVTRSNWSYGAGASIPLGHAIDVFSEARWRMSQYLLPTASSAPSPTNEVRIGLSFHVGGGGPSGGRVGPRDRRSESTPSIMLPAARIPTSGETSTSAQRVIGTAEQYIGVPYKYGGTSPRSGFDCSGFVQYVFARQGVNLPRTASQQAQVGTPIAPDWRAVSAGDLVMFEENGRIGHVAIYAGRNRIIHSTSSGGGVRYDDLSTERGDWFVDHMVAARRVTPDARGLLLDLARGFANGAEVQFDGPDHAPRPR